MLGSGACLDAELLIETTVALRESASDCPPGFTCTSVGCADQTRCGDGPFAIFRDDGEANTDAYSAGQRCSTTCDGYAPYCGERNRLDGEVGDAGAKQDAYSFAGKCNTASALDHIVVMV